MPIETDHQIPLGRERYRFRPWYERPLTEGQLRACLVVCWSVTAVLVVAGAALVWVAGWMDRARDCLVSALVAASLAVLMVAGRDAWLDLDGPSNR